MNKAEQLFKEIAIRDLKLKFNKWNQTFNVFDAGCDCCGCNHELSKDEFIKLIDLMIKQLKSFKKNLQQFKSD